MNTGTGRKAHPAGSLVSWLISWLILTPLLLISCLVDVLVEVVSELVVSTEGELEDERQKTII
ncbi:MAG: hypothetical protein KGH79_04480 [Patescibacteria group bacterium]|nr:hypothetical protein [Patescibacteria group bacterium]